MTTTWSKPLSDMTPVFRKLLNDNLEYAEAKASADRARRQSDEWSDQLEALEATYSARLKALVTRRVGKALGPTTWFKVWVRPLVNHATRPYVCKALVTLAWHGRGGRCESSSLVTEAAELDALVTRFVTAVQTLQEEGGRS